MSMLKREVEEEEEGECIRTMKPDTMINREKMECLKFSKLMIESRS